MVNLEEKLRDIQLTNTRSESSITNDELLEKSINQDRKHLKKYGILNEIIEEKNFKF